jgi:hypothetical protein
MVKANTTVVVDGKQYQKGQTVEGLSDIDRAWMKENGYITATDSAGTKKKTAGTEKENADAGE